MLAVEITDAELDALVGPMFTVGLATKVQHRWWARPEWRVWEVEAPWYERKPATFGRNEVRWAIPASNEPIRIEALMLFEADGTPLFNRSFRVPGTAGPPLCIAEFTLVAHP